MALFPASSGGGLKNAKVYTKTLTNYPVNTAWGAIYSSALYDTNIPFDGTKQGVQATFVATNGACSLYAFEQNGNLTIGFFRGTADVINGIIEILIYDL